MTLDEIVATMSKAGIVNSRAAVQRFYERHDISFKKNTLYAAEQKRAEVVRARWMREQGMFDPARLVFIDETRTNTAIGEKRARRAAFECAAEPNALVTWISVGSDALSRRDCDGRIAEDDDPEAHTQGRRRAAGL